MSELLTPVRTAAVIVLLAALVSGCGLADETPLPRPSPDMQDPRGTPTPDPSCEQVTVAIPTFGAPTSKAGHHVSSVLADVAPFADILGRCEPYPVQAFQGLFYVLEEEIVWVDRQPDTGQGTLIRYGHQVHVVMDAIRNGSAGVPADVAYLRTELIKLLGFGAEIGEFRDQSSPAVRL